MDKIVGTILNGVSVIHTLGPTGTNCEAAAYEWFRRQNKTASVVLHETLESALDNMSRDPEHALLGCVVYPELHTLVFSNLDRMMLAECFIFPTFNMLLASRPENRPVRTVSCHPAPKLLAPKDCKLRFTNSNTQAAIDCVNGITDGCITTLPAAKKHGLRVITDFGPIQMGFTVHINYINPSSASNATCRDEVIHGTD